MKTEGMVPHAAPQLWQVWWCGTALAGEPLCDILNLIQQPMEKTMRTTVTKKDLPDVTSDDPKVKYRKAKALVTLARKNPEQLYPHMAFFVNLLKSENNILKWTAIDIIGYLAHVDKDKQIDRLLGRLCGFLEGGHLITANHAIGALANIAVAKPAHRRTITAELLTVEGYKYETKECHTIALGKVIQALTSYVRLLRPDARVLEFVSRQKRNARSATRKKALKLLNDIDNSAKERRIEQ